MKFDLFMEFASPPGASRNLSDIMEDGLRIARAADTLGIDAVWLAEHHFLGDYCNAAAPDMLLAAMARETRRIGLGFGIIPLPIHDPVRVAERLATLDLLSHGRVLWGVGRGVTLTELEGFGVEPASSREIFRRQFGLLNTILETGTFTREGRHYDLRPRPEPSLGTGWLAAVSPESFELAAELGLNVMTGPFKTTSRPARAPSPVCSGPTARSWRSRARCWPARWLATSTTESSAGWRRRWTRLSACRCSKPWASPLSAIRITWRAASRPCAKAGWTGSAW